MDKTGFIRNVFMSEQGMVIAKDPCNPGRKIKVTLLHTYIAGYQYYKKDHIEARLRHGDKLSLKREPDNPFDTKAVVILSGAEKLGYLPADINSVIAGLMDQDLPVEAEVLEINPENKDRERIIVKALLKVEAESFISYN